MDVNSIQKRTRNLSHVLVNLLRCAGTLLDRRSIVATGAGLRCQSTGPVILTAKKPKSAKFPESLVTIGDHLRAKRLELKLLQKEVARVIGVDETTVYNWEREHTSPPLRYMLKVLEFLGYDPAPNEPKTLGEKLLKYRRDRGMTQKELAQRIGIDPTTLSRIERNRGKKVFRGVLEKVNRSLSRPK